MHCYSPPPRSETAFSDLETPAALCELTQPQQVEASVAAPSSVKRQSPLSPQWQASWKTIKRAASAEGAEIINKVARDSDPCEAFAGQFLAAAEAARRRYPEQGEEGQLEALTEASYDMAEIAQFFRLDAFDASTTTLRQHLEDFYFDVFQKILYKETPQILEDMNRINLACCADKWTCTACQRVSQCFGLPKDGQAVHTLLSGRNNFWARGPEASAKVRIMDTQSSWDMASHRCAVWLVAHSSVGKDLDAEKQHLGS